MSARAALAISPAVLAACAWLSGCTKQPSSAGELRAAVAVVDGQPISVEAFQDEMARRARSPGQLASLEERRALLQELVRFEALYARAREAGYDRDPEVTATLRRMVASKFKEDQLLARGEAAKVTDSDVERYHREHPEEFTVPEQVRAALIFIKAPATAAPEKLQELKEKAETARAEALGLKADVLSFGAVAQKFSEDQASRYQGGDIGWLAPGKKGYRWEDAVLEAIFALALAGEVSPVIHTPAGFYLAKLMETKPKRVRPLEEVKAAIGHQIANARRKEIHAAFDDEVLQKTKVEINDKLLKSLPAPLVSGADRPKPPSVPQR
jgi:parvulin-like peptidyl-prolyl isomerase